MSSTHLLAAAALAAELGVDSLALALALPAHRLHLLHDARAQLLQADLHARPAAVGAALHGALGPAEAVAVLADDVLLQGQLPRGAVVHLL